MRIPRLLGLALLLVTSCKAGSDQPTVGGVATLTVSQASGANVKTTVLHGGLRLSAGLVSGRTSVTYLSEQSQYAWHPFGGIDFRGAPVAGMTYPIDAVNTVSLTEDADLIPERAWLSTAGSITVDTVNANGLSLHFDVTMGKRPPLTDTGNGATGTFRFVGTLLVSDAIVDGGAAD